MAVALATLMPQAAEAADIDSTFATKMIEFMPAPGQFVGTPTAGPGYNYALGEEGQLVSLGGFGGYIILEFGKPVVNDPHNPYGVDFIVKGNSFIANIQGVWTEPGTVMVMKDENHNGLPDDTWYELAGSDYYLSTTKHNLTMTYYNPHYYKRHTMTYRCSDGTAGAMRTNQFHQQSYFPGDYDFTSPNNNPDSISYTGTLIRGCIDLSTPSYIENYRAQLFGYCDNKGANAGEAHNPYTTTMAKGGDGFDLDWAVDKDGNYVTLDTIQWIKIYTSLNQDGGWLGELSTEVAFAQVISPDSNYVPRNYYAHYIGIPQLKAVVGQPIQYEGLLFKNGRPCNEGTPQWTLSNDSCGTIDQTGKFTPTHGGEVYIHFKQLTSCAAADTIVVTEDSVRLRVVELTGVVLEMEGNASAVSNDSTSLFVGEHTFITAQSTDNIGDYINNLKANRYSYDTYTWNSSNPQIGTIQNGLFYAQKAGRTMLYAYSNTNPALYDSILVIVKEPTITTLANPVVLNYKTNEDEYEVTDLFSADGAVITVEKVASDEDYLEWDADDELLYVTFEKGEYQTQTAKFYLKAFNQTFEKDVDFQYKAPDMDATNKQLLFVNGGSFGSATDKTTLKAYDIVTKATSTVGQMDASSVQDMIVDGAYAYVAADNYIARYDIANKKLVASRYVQDTSMLADGQGQNSYGLNSKMVIYNNWLLVTRQNSSYAPEDGYNIRVYNKTDLSLVRKIAVSDQATDITTVGTNAYALINGGYAGTTSTMAIIDLNTLTLTKEVPLGTAGLNVSMLMPKNDTIYAIRRDNYSMTSAVLAYDTKTNTYTETANNMPSSFNSAPAAIDPMTDNTILLANDTGFVAYDINTKTTSTTGVMATITAGLNPMGSTRDTETGNYYVAYGTWSGNGEGRIFNADFTPAGTFDGVGASPEAMDMSSQLNINSAPIIGAKTTTKALNINETATYTSVVQVYKSGFTDLEGNLDNVYLKNWATYSDWITPDFTYTSGAKFKYIFPESLRNNLGKDSVVHIYAEAIDTYGASVEYEAYTFTLRPAVYTIYANTIADVTVEKNAADMTFSLAKAFTWQKSSSVTYAKSIKENTNLDLVTATINGDDITLSFAADKIGTADITVLQTGRYNNKDTYTKSAESTFHVTVTDETPTGLDDINGDDLIVYPNPIVDFMNVQLTEAGTIYVYDLTGQCVACVAGHAGVNTIATTTWTNGVYLVQCNDLTAKVVK